MKRMALVVLGALAVNAAVATAQTATTSSGPTARDGRRHEAVALPDRPDGARARGRRRARRANIRDRLQAVGPTELLISDNARARGFRLDGYGVFFDVVVPSLDTTVLWSIRTLDQNDLGLESALKALQAHVRNAGDVEPRTGAAAHRAADEPAPAGRGPPRRRRRARGPQRDRVGGRGQRRRRAAAARRSDLCQSERGVSGRGHAGADGCAARSQRLARDRARTSG